MAWRKGSASLAELTTGAVSLGEKVEREKRRLGLTESPMPNAATAREALESLEELLLRARWWPESEASGGGLDSATREALQ